MASTGVTIGHGARVRVGRGSTPTWTTLSGVKDITLPSRPPTDEDVTSMDSPGFTEEFIPGLFTAPDWSLEKDYVPEDAEDVLLLALMRSQEIVLLEILPSGGTVARVWQGYVKEWLATLPVKNGMRGTLTMKVMAEVVS